MDEAIKQAWVDALRSGKYKQGSGELLSRSGRYCCIGVLGLITGRSKAELQDGIAGWRTLGGLEEEQGDELADMNDAGKNFAEIADYIERLP